MEKYKCPCCENFTLEEEPFHHTYEICPVCFWEDDVLNEEEISEANGGLTLKKARENYRSFGACDENFINVVEKK